MEKLKLNDTPLRTSNNYGINDITLDIEIPTIKSFQNFTIQTYEPEENLEINYLCENNVINSKIGLEMNSNNEISLVVPKNKICKTPIILEYEFDEDNSNLVSNIKIEMKDNSKAEFIILYYTEDMEIDFFNYLKQETIINNNANANIKIINILNDKTKSFIAVDNRLNENAKLKHTIIDLGGDYKISNYYSKLVGDMSGNVLNNIYIGTNNDILDINYNIDILGKKTKSSINSNGALSGKAHKNFKGTIDFKEGAVKSKGLERENCIILSETAKSKSLPMLLCHEEDVEGEHSVATGKPNEQEIFYLMSRGISYNEARRLLVKSNFNTVLNDIKNENIKNKIEERIDSLLSK